MDENYIKSVIKEDKKQTQNINIINIQKLPLINNKNFLNNLIQNHQKSNYNNTIDNKNNLEKNVPLLKLLPNKSKFIGTENCKLIKNIPNKDKMYSFTVRNKLFPIKNTKHTKNSHPLDKLFKKNKVKNTIKDFKINNMLDIIHNKEIETCLDLIKSLPSNSRNNIKELNHINNIKNEETNNLIQSIKMFNIDNINNQKILENQILNNKTNVNSNLNTLDNTLTLSRPINNNSNKIRLNNIYKFNNRNKNNLFYSSKSIKNNRNNIKNINDSHIIKCKSNNCSLNEDLSKSKLIKSTNEKKGNININNNKKNEMGYFKNNEINFKTGFVRKQKNIFGTVYHKYLKNKAKSEIKINKYMNKKDLINKLSLPEIEEYKSIIKDIEKHKKKNLKKANSTLNTNVENNDLNLKDNFINELNNIYINQKNIFLSDLKKSIGNKIYYAQTYKKKVNENIENINKINRSPNIFIDGYSVLDGNINKKLYQYNYILGNHFYDKEQKLKKAEKFYQISDEFEKTIKNNENKLFKDTNLYYQSLMPKFNFNSDKNNNELQKDAKSNLNKKIISNQHSSNISLESGKTFKMDISKYSKNISANSKNEDKIYDDYINFKKEYRKKYSFD